MPLYLNRRVEFDGERSWPLRILTEAHGSWSRGWIALLNDGRRSFLDPIDEQLSNNRNGLREFLVDAPGLYEVDSVCRSYRSHRLRFRLREDRRVDFLASRDARRCHHLRAFEATDTLDLAILDLGVVEDHAWPEPLDRPKKAALLLGGALEAHLRVLCAHQQPPITTLDAKGRGVGTEAMDNALKSRGVYPKAQSKAVKRWAALRAEVQHRGGEPEPEAVMAAIREFADFRNRYPA